jgi:hypothetical protein
VQVTTGRSIRRLLSSWLRLTAGLGPDPDHTLTYRSKSMLIDALPRQYVSVDGEAFISTPFQVDVAQQALLVMVSRLNHQLQ